MKMVHQQQFLDKLYQTQHSKITLAHRCHEGPRNKREKKKGKEVEGVEEGKE